MQKTFESPANQKKQLRHKIFAEGNSLNADIKSLSARLHQALFSAGMLFLIFTPNSALASSDDSWEEFRSDVKRSCTKALSDFSIKNIRVDDFGTESYGFSIISGTVKGDSKIRQLRLCIYDKKSKKSEIIEIGSLETIKSLMTE